MDLLNIIDDNSPCSNNSLILSNTKEHSVVVLEATTIGGMKASLILEKNYPTFFKC